MSAVLASLPVVLAEPPICVLVERMSPIWLFPRGTELAVLLALPSPVSITWSNGTDCFAYAIVKLPLLPDTARLKLDDAS